MIKYKELKLKIMIEWNLFNKSQKTFHNYNPNSIEWDDI
jgi:hypothetical protein